MVSMPITLNPQQRSVVDELTEQQFPSKLLALPTNFGKTLTILKMLEEHPDDLLPALIIAPKRVSERSWIEDFNKLESGLKLHLFDAQKVKRADMRVPDGTDILVTSFHNFHRAAGEIDAGYFKTLIIDEVDLMKSSTSARWKTARKMRKHFQRCYGMTGTAIPSDLTTIWAMMYLIDQGRTLGGRKGEYLTKYFRPGYQLPSGVVASYEELDGARDKILERMKLGSIIRTTDVSQLVEYDTEYIELPMSERQSRLFKLAMTESIQELRKPNDSEEDVVKKLLESTSAKAATMRQLSSGLQMDEGDASTVEWVNPAKIDYLEMVLSGEPALIFFQYVAEREEILARLGSDVELVTVPGAIERWNNRQTKYLLAHPASVSHGVNLQFGGSKVVWVSLPPTYSIFHQGCMRVARRGQKDRVTVSVIRFKNVLESKRSSAYSKQQMSNEKFLGA